MTRLSREWGTFPTFSYSNETFCGRLRGSLFLEVKGTVEELAKQWPAAHWQRFRVLEGHKGPLVADFLVSHRKRLLAQLQELRW